MIMVLPESTKFWGFISFSSVGVQLGRKVGTEYYKVYCTKIQTITKSITKFTHIYRDISNFIMSFLWIPLPIQFKKV